MAEQLNKKPGMFNLGAKGWGIVFVGFWLNLFWSGPITAGTNFWFTYLEGEYGWTTVELSVPLTIGGIISMFGAIVWGRMTAKIGAKATSLVTLAIAGLCSMIFPLTMSMGGFAATIIIYQFCGIGHGIITLGQFGADWFPRKKGIYMGFVTLGCTLMTSFLPLVLTLLVPKYGVFNILMVLAVAEILVGVIIFFTAKNVPEEAGAYPDNDKSFSREVLNRQFAAMEAYKKVSPWNTKTLLKESTVWKIGIGFGLVMMCAMGTIVQVVPALVSFGHDMMLGVTFLSMAWPIGLIAHLLIGVLDQKISTWRTSIVVGVITAIGFAMLTFAGSSAVGALGGIGCMIFGMSGVQNMVMSMTTTAFGRKDFNGAWSLISMIYQLITQVGVLVLALLAASLSYKYAFLVILILCVVGIVIMVFTTKKELPLPKGAALPEKELAELEAAEAAAAQGA